MKDRLTNKPGSLYNQEWIEKTATEGYERMAETLKKESPTISAAVENYPWFFESIYYTAFEDALNTFILQVLEDELHNVSLCLDELHKITASIHTKK